MTNNSPAEPQIAVIGAGIVGIACASYLQRDGHRVAVLDPLPPGEACSFGNAGAISTGSCVPMAGPGLWSQIPGWLVDPLGPLSLRWSYLPHALPWLLRCLRAGRPDKVEAQSKAMHALFARAWDAYQPLIKSAGAADMLRRNGYVYVYESEEAYAKEAGAWRLRRARGLPMEELGADEIRQIEPSLAPIFKRGVLLSDAGHCINPQRLVQVLAEHFLRNGGEIRRARVTDLSTGATGVTLSTEAGTFTVPRAVIAAGAWSHQLAAKLGCKIPLETERGYHATLKNPGVAPRLPVMSGEGKFLATPMEMGLRVAGTAEFAGLDAPPDYARARALVTRAKRMFPQLCDTEMSVWMGHRPCLPDTLPVIGAAPGAPNVYFAFGHGHLGLTGGAATGQLIADLVAGRQPPIDLAPYRADRF
ncbi:MAG: FAD-binding oxidoreductase [Proteobacteria bacterium]|nr:FAD-binding oxidoreductase [Pseudomonadota bacterium]